MPQTVLHLLVWVQHCRDAINEMVLHLISLSRMIEQHPRRTIMRIARVRWAALLQMRQTWAFLAAKFLTDPIWWFYLYWLPGFLQREHGLNAQITLISPERAPS